MKNLKCVNHIIVHLIKHIKNNILSKNGGRCKMFNEESILKQLYDLRKEDYEIFINRNSSELKTITDKIIESQEKIFSFLKDKIAENELKEFKFLFHNFQIKSYAEFDFWMWQYYKLGLVDYKKLNKELNNINDNSIEIDANSDDILFYLQKNEKNILYNDSKYNELRTRQKEIKEKHNKILKFVEDDEVSEMNLEELKALKELKNIEIEMDAIESVLAFKLGTSIN